MTVPLEWESLAFQGDRIRSHGRDCFDFEVMCPPLTAKLVVIVSGIRERHSIEKSMLSVFSELFRFIIFKPGGYASR